MEASGASDKVAFWYYRNKDDQSADPWLMYRDIEMTVIEQAYQEKKNEVFLDQYRIDLKRFVQYDRSNVEDFCPVIRRTDCRREERLREERFFSPVIPMPMSSYGAAQAWCPLLNEWLKTTAGKKALINFSSAIDSCIEGIREEALQNNSNSQTEAEWMIEQLRTAKGKSRRDVSILCIHLYTRESFLYRVLNTALRDNDQSKLHTMGPLCFLIRNYSNTCQKFVGTVYRGVNLSPEMIKSYKEAINMWRTWPSYTSTTKYRDVAELRGNTLIIIHIVPFTVASTVRAYDVSGYSQFPTEEEVLLPAGISFQVIRVDDPPGKKTMIEIKI